MEKVSVVLEAEQIRTLARFVQKPYVVIVFDGNGKFVSAGEYDTRTKARKAASQGGVG